MILTTLLYATCFVSSVSSAVLDKRVVFDPPILYPNAGTVWATGEVHNVTWDISNAPPGFPLDTATGMIVLGFDENDSENLDLDNPLAKNFLIKSARVNITVPQVPTRSNYIVVLFGDSGNSSPDFTIKNITISSPATPTPSMPATTPSSVHDTGSAMSGLSTDIPSTHFTGSESAGTGAGSGNGNTTPSDSGASTPASNLSTSGTSSSASGTNSTPAAAASQTSAATAPAPAATTPSAAWKSIPNSWWLLFSAALVAFT